MQLKNLSVAHKVWLLLGIVMLMLVTTCVGMALYMARLEDALRQDVQYMEQRMRSAMQLRAGIEIGASAIMAAEVASDTKTHAFFEARFRQVQADNVRLMQDLESRISTDEGRQIFARLMEHIARADHLIDSLGPRRMEGADVGAIVRNELMPVLTNFITELDRMVARQVQLLEQGLDVAQAQRGRAWSVVGGIFVLVIAAGALLSRRLVRQLTEPLASAVELANEIAQGNLTRDIQTDRHDELGQLLHALQTMTHKLRLLVGEVHQGVQSVSTAAEQMASGNQHLSARTEQTAANLEETAASMEELTATVTQSAQTASQASDLAVQAVQAAEQGGQVVQQVVSSMAQIHSSSRRIGDIIGVIDGIAFQTNILALNAAVEAARAGEQGRGFAVVAGEVRSLAGRSAEAAKEIKQLIGESVHSVELGSEQVAQAGQRMQAIVSSIRQVTGLIGDISASSHTQREGIRQVHDAISNLDQMTQQNAVLVEDSSTAAHAMNAQAHRLAEVAAVFKLGQAQQLL